MTVVDARVERAFAALDAALPAAIELRRSIHRQPRIGGDEYDTRDAVRAALPAATVTDVVEGCLARIGGPGRAVAVRAELDALPITETSGLAWASERPGVAHLCGHDVHTAALVATAHAVAALADGDEQTVPLLAVFQPREEVVPPGARDFGPRPELAATAVRGIVGVHVQPVLPFGTFSAEPGPINASADNFEITIHGRPAHGAYPHLGRDPILAAAAVVQALQQLVSRRSDPMQPAVVTIGAIAGGSVANAVPASVELRGTVRAYDETHRQRLHADLAAIAEATAVAHGCTAAVEVEFGEPVLDNDELLAEVVAAALSRRGLAAGTPLRSCGADDFAYYAARIPSLMIFAGVGDPDAGDEQPGLHHPAFVPGDDAVRHVAHIMLTSYLAIADTAIAEAVERAPG